MPRVKVDYYEQYALVSERIQQMFPNSLGMLTTEEVAKYFGCTVKTVRRMRARKRNPLPSVDISDSGRPKYRYPIAGVVRYSLGG